MTVASMILPARGSYGHAGKPEQASDSVYLVRRKWGCAGQFFTGSVGGLRMVAIAIAMFIALFGWGANYFGWSDPGHKVQLALAASFILGILSGYKARG
jgi:hypothetical protein